MTITPVRNEHGEIANFVAIKQDITERRRAESALRVRDRAFDTSVSALSTADLAGNVTYVNAAFVKMFGLASAAEILGKPFVPLFVDPAAVESSVRTLQEQGHWMGELKARRTDGAAVDIFVSASIATDDTGEPLCLVASLFDITERRHVEEALRVSSAYTRSLIEASLDPLVTIGPEGKITDVNAATETATGRKRTELIGTDFSGYFTDPENAKAGYQQVFREGSVRDYPLELRHRDGGVISVLYNATVYCDADGKVVGVFAAARDITERERAEASLRETNRRLENALADLKNAEQQVIQQERLSALGTMASGIAHDFNNSLTAILGGSELLLSRPEYLDDKEKARSYIEMMATAAQDAGKIVNRLREFYRHREDSEVLAPVNINDLVSEVVALTQPKWKAEAEVRSVSVNVHTELQEVPQIAGNAANLREMLTNLIFNAVDAMPRGGTITIRTRRDKDHVVLDVIDTGTGMTDEVRRRCLEPFFTTEGQRGTGLGLSMVYGILQRHQSTLEIETEVGKGTTFVIRLPVQTAQLQFAPITQPLNVTQPLHVLVVDDETVVRKIVGEYLKMDGHIVEAANSGDDGLEKFRNSRFDLVLVDRAMPGMSGDQVAATIKDANPAVPVIMLTGFGAMMEAADEKPTGVDFIVGKPVTIKALRAAVSKAVASVN
jgi:PAS domain S-box-containing protein